jgi:hypothetical protein
MEASSLRWSRIGSILDRLDQGWLVHAVAEVEGVLTTARFVYKRRSASSRVTRPSLPALAREAASTGSGERLSGGRAASEAACVAAVTAPLTRAANRAPYRPLRESVWVGAVGARTVGRVLTRQSETRRGTTARTLRDFPCGTCFGGSRPALHPRAWEGTAGASEAESGMPDSFPLRSPARPTALRTAPPSPALPRKRRRGTNSVRLRRGGPRSEARFRLRRPWACPLN